MKITCLAFGAATEMLVGCAPVRNVAQQPYGTCAPYDFARKKCAVVPLASGKVDQLVRSFHPLPADKARVFIVRRFKLAYQRTSDLFINGAPIASLGLETYLMLDVVSKQHSSPTWVSSTPGTS